MITLKQIFESKKDYKSDVFFHGTSHKDIAQMILSNGYLKPYNGEIFLSRKLSIPVDFAIGWPGGPISQKDINKYGRYGYLFVVEGSYLHLNKYDEQSMLDMDEIGFPVHTNKNIPFKQAWKLDKLLAMKLNPPSNDKFFAFAKRIK